MELFVDCVTVRFKVDFRWLGRYLWKLVWNPSCSDLGTTDCNYKH